MPELEPQRLDVPGATLEVLTGGAVGPLVCVVPHPLLPPSREGGVLAELSRVVKVSPRGLGGSSAGAEPHDLTIDRLVDDVDALRRHLGLDRWLLHGSSAGGEVLLRYALRYPQAVAALVLTGCPPGFYRLLDDPRTPLSPAYPDWQRLLERRPPAAGRGWVWTPLQEPPEVWMLAEDGRPRLTVRGIPESGPTARDRVVCQEIVRFRFGAGDLGRIRAPTLVLHGRHDSIVPLEYGAALSAALPNAELVVLEHSEHPVTRAEPERYREVVGRFLAAHAPPSARPAAPA